MKKFLTLLMILALILCAGCAKEQPAQAEAPTESTEETAAPETETLPEPEVTMGTALADNTPLVLDTLKRGDTVELVGEYDKEHYVIKTAQGYGMVEKNLLRPESEAAYESWTAYAQSGAVLYGDLYLAEAPVKTLEQNEKAEVLEDLGHCYVVQVGDTTGFMLPGQLSKWQVGEGGDNGGSGGGATYGDGGDISLGIRGGISLLSTVEQKGDVTGKGVILADGTPVLLGYFDRGDSIPMVVEEGLAESREGYITVWMKGLFAYVPRELCVTEDDPAYEQWDGYSNWQGDLYDNYRLMGQPLKRLSTNQQVVVLQELENCYLVQAGEMVGFMSKDVVTESPTYYGGNPGGGTGGGTGGGGAAGGAAGGDSAEWTPPAL